MFSKWHKNLIPAPLGSETHLSMAQWGSVLVPEASPHHYRAATMWSHLLNAVLMESLSWSPPDQNGMAVRALKAEPGLISEDDLGPLLMRPLSMIPAPALLSSFVGRCQLWSLCWATGAEVGSSQAVPQGLCGDFGVGGHPPDAICSRFPRCLVLSGDLVFHGCGLFGPVWSRPVLDLAGGAEALLQAHNG